MTGPIVVKRSFTALCGGDPFWARIETVKRDGNSIIEKMYDNKGTKAVTHEFQNTMLETIHGPHLKFKRS